MELVSFKEKIKAGPIFNNDNVDIGQKTRTRNGAVKTESSYSRPKSRLKIGILRASGAEGITKVLHPLNRELFGSPKYSDAFKKIDLVKQAGLEKTEGRPQ